MEQIKLPEIEICLTYKGNVKKSELKVIRSSRDIYEILQPLFSNSIDWQEEMLMLCLNQANKVVSYYRVSRGGMTGTVCDPRIVFTVALNAGACKIILAHNHPSGNLTPSEADKTITKKITGAGQFMDILLLDHLIVTDEGYYSFSDEGML